MQIIPAIDIIEGKCVRLTQGDYLQKRYIMKIPWKWQKLKKKKIFFSSFSI